MKNLIHSFSVHDAVRLKSVEKAVIIYNLRYWLHKNQANENHFYDGYVWTYNSMKAYSILFPYLNEKKLYNLFSQLEAIGEIKTANYNKSKYNRTKWYTLPNEFGILETSISQNQEMHIPDKEKPISQIQEMEIPNMGNQIPKSGNCIYNTDINTDINKNINKEKDFFIVQCLNSFKEIYLRNINQNYKEVEEDENSIYQIIELLNLSKNLSNNEKLNRIAAAFNIIISSSNAGYRQNMSLKFIVSHWVTFQEILKGNNHVETFEEIFSNEIYLEKLAMDYSMPIEVIKTISNDFIRDRINTEGYTQGTMKLKEYFINIIKKTKRDGDSKRNQNSNTGSKRTDEIITNLTARIQEADRKFLSGEVPDTCDAPF